MIYMSRTTGKAISRIDHIRQSIADILTTPVGSRVMNREYGSRLLELVDGAGNPETRMRIHAAAAEAIVRWEPRIKLNRVTVSVADGSGTMNINVEGEVISESQNPQSAFFSIPLDSTPGQLAA